MDWTGGPPLAKTFKDWWVRLSAPSRGIILMVVSTMCFSIMHTAVRYLSGELHPLQIVFFRNLFGMILFLPLVWRSGLSFMTTQRLPMHLLRAGLNVMAMTTFFIALSMTPLARVNALAFSAPLFTAVLSVLLLGERFRLRRWSAIVFGFIGAIVILRPGVTTIDLGSWLTLLAAFIWGLTMIVIRSLGKTESSLTTTGYMITFLSILSLGPALTVWQTPQGMAWAILLLIGISGTIAQILLAESLRTAETTVVLPFDFLKIVWASMLGFMLFTEVPTLTTWVGAAIIFTSSFYVAYRERKIDKRQAVRPIGSP
jgi:drug/metabolite transporter (DMT)-like permease